MCSECGWDQDYELPEDQTDEIADLEDEERMIGERIECTVCRRTKKPIGRSASLEMANSLCDDDCQGYRLDPQPSQLWPGEDGSWLEELFKKIELS